MKQSTGLPVNVMIQKTSSVTRGQLNLKLYMIASGCNIRNQFKRWSITLNDEYTLYTEEEEEEETLMGVQEIRNMTLVLLYGFIHYFLYFKVYVK